MTSPSLAPDCVVAGLLVMPHTPVLQRRTLHPDADLARSPVFSDARWDLHAALADRHTARQTLNWTRYPAELRHACKLYAFALVNVIEDPPRLLNARGAVPAVKTLVADLGYLHAFTAWLADRGTRRFADVTTADLDSYYRHVTDAMATSTSWRRKALVAVQRLHAYRQVLPEDCRLPAPRPWGGASAAELAGNQAVRRGENRASRIHPDVMQPLLSAALLVTDVIAADLIPTARRLTAMRRLAHQVAPSARRHQPQGAERRHVLQQHLEHLLPALAAHGHALPGLRDADQTILDLDGLTIGGWLDHTYLRKVPALKQTLNTCGLPIKADLLRVTRYSQIGARPWRDRPIGASELIEVLRHVSTACFLTIAYLSGVRTGEALNLRRGCITRDAKLGLTFMSGQQMKAGEGGRERSPATVPWVVTEHAARAVSVLEDLAIGSMLFPRGRFCTEEWFIDGPSLSRTPGCVSGDIAAFIAWFNTDIAPVTGHPVIGDDPDGKIIGPRLRRTLAWHIVRRPGGTVAGATQYGHVHTQVTTGYAGRADSGFLDEITFEEFLLRAETIHDDHQRLTHGEHVSGPAADAYRTRVAAGSRFAGLTITTQTQADNALANPALNIHHGALLTCVYRPQTAACRDEDDDNAGGGPAWPRCRPSCRNIARTDRDIAELRQHVGGLTADLAAPGLPEPLRQRIRQRLQEHERAIAEHHSSDVRPRADAGPGATS